MDPQIHRSCSVIVSRSQTWTLRTRIRTLLSISISLDKTPHYSMENFLMPLFFGWLLTGGQTTHSTHFPREAAAEYKCIRHWWCLLPFHIAFDLDGDAVPFSCHSQHTLSDLLALPFSPKLLVKISINKSRN